MPVGNRPGEITLTAKVIELGAHSNMSVKDALNFALREDLADVVIVGYDQEGKIVIRSSHMDRANAFYLLEQAKLHALNVNTDQ